MVDMPLRYLPRLIETDQRYQLASSVFLRAIALIYLAAFFSASLDITGLVGEQGILPTADYLDRARDYYGAFAWLRLPTIFWLNHSDVALLGATYAGCALSVALLLGWRPLLTTTLLFVLYLSLFRAGQLFFNFQWDYLLLEAGLLTIFLTQGPSRLLIFLFHWLLFRLRFFSGLSKILSGDPSWSGLTALNHYFESQPLPHIGAWYAHQLPDWVLRAGTGFTLFVELLVPFFIFLPRPFRIFAAVSTLIMQLLIIATSNHNFINILTIALCLFLLDDRALRWIPTWRSGVGRGNLKPMIRGIMLWPVAVLVLVSSLTVSYEFFLGNRPPATLASLAKVVRAWGQGNTYHVFPTMQTDRQELTIEGSNDGLTWKPYRFKFKPNDQGDRPAFIVPLHPRLDWMMWFIPPQNPAMRAWFEAFLWRLHTNSPSVTALLAHNPFPVEGPRYLRVKAFHFRFSTPEERQRDGRVWQTRYLGEFPRVPPRSP